MDPRTKDSLLWGLVGTLSFLVLVQGYQLLTEATVNVWAMFGVALAVGAGATGLTHVARARLFGSESP
ncbi:hypothetical protein [Halomicrobium salinisoli]|uniref:hypothetical protein n=1 Tax=Halomicrobium salinisoli TaxID=2878391 RepID=UPI001CEFB32C|nr:hypothetical protein [Halomicrobium salinisoli]